MASPDEVVEKVKARLAPSEEEERRLRNATNEMISRLERVIRSRGLEAEVRVGGSFAHGTWLPGDVDVDVFIVLDTGADLERDGLSAALEAARDLRTEVRYAEHPYARALLDGVWIEIVPCYNVKRGEWISAADRSPYHTEYLKKRLDDDLRMETRVTKAFMKAQGVYGAEIRVRGFSGYLAEILTLAYGSFVDLVRAAVGWGMGEVVYVEKPGLDVKSIHRNAPLIVPDPVDERRNLAAALSMEKLGRFILACDRFLSEPSEDHFLGFTGGRARDVGLLNDKLLALVFAKPSKPDEVLWGEIWRTAKGLAKQLNIAGFNVVKFSAGVDDRTASIVFLLDNVKCCSLRLRRGPFVFMRDARRSFVKARLKDSLLVWVGEDGRLYSMTVSEPLEARSVLTDLVKSPVEKAGAARGLERSIRETGRVLVGEEVRDEGLGSLSSALRALLEGDA